MNTQIPLIDFLKVLESPTILDERTNKGLKQLGLIVYDSEEEKAFKIIKESFKNLKIGGVNINNENSDQSFKLELADALQAGEVILINIESDVSPSILSVLKGLSEENNYVDSEISVRLSKPIICLVSKEIIETKISYPHFYDLFGPVYHID